MHDDDGDVFYFISLSCYMFSIIFLLLNTGFLYIFFYYNSFELLLSYI